jgi:hypothetical protein
MRKSSGNPAGAFFRHAITRDHSQAATMASPQLDAVRRCAVVHCAQ